MTKRKIRDKFTLAVLKKLVNYLQGQTLILRYIYGVQRVSKEDCLTIEQAAAALGSSKATLYNYMNILGIQRLKFPFDRRTYVMKVDVERMRRFVEENRG